MEDTKVLIWHNPRCSKSRQALHLLEEKGMELEIRRYLENPLSADELLQATALIEPSSLVRIKEAEVLPWRQELPHMNREEITELLLRFPKAMERPVVFYKGKAVIARPPERIEELF